MLLLLFSHSVVSDCNPMDGSTPGFSVHHYILEFTHRVMSLSQWCHPAISSSVTTFSSCHQSFLAWSFSMSRLFASGGQSIGASASSVLPVNIQGWFISFRIDSPKDSQESSPTPQFKSINPSMVSLLYGPALTSICGYWKNYSFDYTDLCWQSNISAF